MTKELEALDFIKNTIEELQYYNRSVKIDNSIYDLFDTIKQYILKAQEQENMLEVIFNKGLPLAEIKIIKQSENYEKYSIAYSWANWKNASIQKTQEEFDLLKRYFDEH